MITISFLRAINDLSLCLQDHHLAFEAALLPVVNFWS
jgi:hypothetical protein